MAEAFEKTRNDLRVLPVCLEDLYGPPDGGDFKDAVRAMLRAVLDCFNLTRVLLGPRQGVSCGLGVFELYYGDGGGFRDTARRKRALFALGSSVSARDAAGPCRSSGCMNSSGSAPRTSRPVRSAALRSSTPSSTPPRGSTTPGAARLTESANEEVTDKFGNVKSIF